MNWVNYMVMAAQHSRGNAGHWFRYLRKYIDKCGTVFTMDDVDILYNSQALTPFQRVSIKAAFRDGSPTRQHIIMLNEPRHRDTLSLIKAKLEVSGREQDLQDVAAILKNNKDTQPLELLPELKDIGFNPDVSAVLDVFELVNGMDWLMEFYEKHESELQNYY